MQKLQLFICYIFLSAFLASCGQSNVPPVVQTDSVPDTSTQITLQERKDYDIPRPKKDWIEALNTFATENPAFAGYDFSADRKELIFYVAEKRKGQKIEFDSEESRGRKLGHMRKEFLELIDRSTGFPEVTNGHGTTVNPRSLKLRSVKSSISLADLNEYRATLQEFLYSGKANGISIDFAQNKINLQVSNKTDQEAALDFLRNHGISSESVNFTIGTIINTKTLFDSFRPAVGGVNVVYGSSNATIPPFFACTLGLSVLVDTIEGYLTASHCSLTEGVSNDGSALYQAGTIIGNKTLDNAFYACTNNGNPAKCKNADTAFYKSTIPITRGRIIFPTGGIGSILTASTNGDTYYDVTAVAERVGNGEVLSSIGASGGYRTATVTNWNYDSVLSPTANTFQILKGTVKVSNTTNFGAECTGDSGGPWFQITGSTTAKFAGIAAQADTPLIKRTLPDGSLSQCLSNGYFSPVAQIRIAYPGRVFQFTR